MRTRLLGLVAAVVALVGCTSSSDGGVDVGTLKVTSTATVPLHGPGLLSPDGTKVLELHRPVCIIHVDGSHKVCMSRDVEVAPDVLYAVWSPDSKYVAFTDNFFQFFLEPDIWVMDAASGKVTDLTDDGIHKALEAGAIPSGANLDVYPSWSADSTTIRFARQVGDSGHIDLDSVPVSGGKVSKLGTISGRLSNLFGLTFSPDGTMVAYSYSNDLRHGTVHLQQFGVFGTSSHTLGRSDDDHSILSFSPDSQYLLVDSKAPYQTFTTAQAGASTARVYPVSGGRGGLVARGVRALWPTWAPSGRALAFVTLARNGKSTVQVVAEPGGTPRTIQSGTEYAAMNYAPRLDWEGEGILLDAAGKATLLKLG